jgi:methylase of polypeptide subunit release factors
VKDPVFRIRAAVQGRKIDLLVHATDLFVPNLMSWFSAAQMHVRKGDVFLDVGVGSGLHAILAAKLGARRVYGTDINPTALRFARENARRNGVAGICRFLRGSLVAPLVERGIRVDAMIYNAPQFPGLAVDPNLPPKLRRSVDGGPAGGDLNSRFLAQARRALAPGGRIYNPIVGWANPDASWRAIRRTGYEVHEVARVHVPPWGRGNNTRQRLVGRPGKHVFAFRHSAGKDTTALLLELRQDGQPAAGRRKPLTVTVDFRKLRNGD